MVGVGATTVKGDGVVIKRRIKIIKESFITPEHSWQWMRESTFIECVAKRPPAIKANARRAYIIICTLLYAPVAKRIYATAAVLFI